MKNEGESLTRPRFSAPLTDRGVFMIRLSPLSSLSRDAAVVEAGHLGHDLFERALKGEVAGVQPMHFSSRQPLEIGFAALRREEDVVLPPEDDRLGLPFLQKGLPFRVELDIGSVVVEEVE